MTRKLAPDLAEAVDWAFSDDEPVVTQFRAVMSVVRAALPAGDTVCGCPKCHPLINRLRVANARLRRVSAPAPSNEKRAGRSRRSRSGGDR